MRFELRLTLAAQHVGVTTSNITKAVARFEKDGNRQLWPGNLGHNVPYALFYFTLFHYA